MMADQILDEMIKDLQQQTDSSIGNTTARVVKCSNLLNNPYEIWGQDKVNEEVRELMSENKWPCISQGMQETKEHMREDERFTYWMCMSNMIEYYPLTFIIKDGIMHDFVVFKVDCKVVVRATGSDLKQEPSMEYLLHGCHAESDDKTEYLRGSIQEYNMDPRSVFVKPSIVYSNLKDVLKMVFKSFSNLEEYDNIVPQLSPKKNFRSVRMDIYPFPQQRYPLSSEEDEMGESSKTRKPRKLLPDNADAVATGDGTKICKVVKPDFFNRMSSYIYWCIFIPNDNKRVRLYISNQPIVSNGVIEYHVIV